jgi:hypothetical protein
MRPVLLQFSFLVGTLSVVSQITSNVDLLTALGRGGAAALGILLVMFVGDLSISWIVRQTDDSVETKAADLPEDSAATGSVRRSRQALAA